MKVDSLTTLLDELSSGDSAAMEKAFVTYEPYLRMIVRRQFPTKLRAKFDSVDIVQSVWVDIIRGLRKGGWRFSDAHHLRAFLVRVTRNRMIDRVRKHRKRAQCEQPLPDAQSDKLLSTNQFEPSEEVQAGDLWDQLLTLCPPAHHELLRLKRQGLSLAEIAARTGLHESSVRRILYDLARRLHEHHQSSAQGCSAVFDH
jgi:RNA polymerase sigma-70 factor (ECF subfamily)